MAGKKEKHQTLTIFKEQPKHSLKNTLSRHPGLQTKDNIFEWDKGENVPFNHRALFYPVKVKEVSFGFDFACLLITLKGEVH